MFNRRYYVIALILSLSVLIETVSFTYMQQAGGVFYYSSSILYFLSGLAICLLPLIPITSTTRSIKDPVNLSRVIAGTFALLFLSLIVYHIIILAHWYGRAPIDKKYADMLPTIKIACQRLLAGEMVYAPAPQIWPDAVMPYFPMMWMPFLPAEILGFDYRWITLLFHLLGLGLALVPIFVRRSPIPLVPAIISGTSLFLFANFFLQTDVRYWILTEEGVVSGFYLLLGFALLRRNYWWIGVCITACTLSRYSLILWIPVYFCFVFLTRPRGDFLRLIGGFILTMSIFFVIPYFIRDPAYFIHIPATYTKNLDRFWRDGNLDQHQFFNVGFYKFFNSSNVKMMTIWEVLTSFGAPALLLAGVWYIRKKDIINAKYLAFASLKLSLLCFFCFIQIPYQYVFVPVTIISYTVLLDYISTLQDERGETEMRYESQ